MKKEIVLKQLGSRVREIRIEKGFSQSGLANSIGKDQQSIHRLESGNINPSFYFLYQVSIGLEVEIEHITRSPFLQKI